MQMMTLDDAATDGTTPTSSSDHAVSTDRLGKRFGRVPVLHDVSLRVPTGSLFGFLGPNGAGKTTAIRILLGLLNPTCGAAHILGRDVRTDGPRVRADVGYLPGDVRFYTRMTGRAVLAFFSHVRRTHCDDAIEELATLFDLELDKRVRNYSRGMKQKLGLIQAMMHRPRVLILDEPTASLDPLVSEALYDHLRKLAAAGCTVLFSSHSLSEVEHLCDTVAILREGRLIEQERIEVLRRRAVRLVRVALTPNQPAPDRLPDAFHIAARTDRVLTGQWTGPIHDLIRWLASIPCTDVTITPPSLEDLFLAYYDPTGHNNDEIRPGFGSIGDAHAGGAETSPQRPATTDDRRTAAVPNTDPSVSSGSTGQSTGARRAAPDAPDGDAGNVSDGDAGDDDR